MPPRINIRAVAPSERGCGHERIGEYLVQSGFGRLVVVVEGNETILGEINIGEGPEATLLVTDKGVSPASGGRVYQPSALAAGSQEIPIDQLFT